VSAACEGARPLFRLDYPDQRANLLLTGNDPGLGKRCLNVAVNTQEITTIRQVKAYLDAALALFVADPPDSAFQVGYQAALSELNRIIVRNPSEPAVEPVKLVNPARQFGDGARFDTSPLAL
jgi:hypothetical protein